MLIVLDLPAQLVWNKMDLLDNKRKIYAYLICVAWQVLFQLVCSNIPNLNLQTESVSAQQLDIHGEIEPHKKR